MLYISVSSVLERSDENTADELRALALTLGLGEDATPETILSFFLNDHLAEMVRQHLRNGVSMNAALIVDENREVVYTDATFLATGVGQDAQGNTVFFTSAGPLTVID